MNRVVVFCGASLGFCTDYQNAAISLGNYLANNKITLIYGGGKIGMMGVLADSVLSKKGKVIGVIPKLLKHEEVVHPNTTEMIVTNTMSERKVVMSKLTDGYIVLPGGFGTLDELFEVLTLGQLYIEQKPIGLLNINGFFNPILNQFDLMVKEGFLKQQNRELLFVDTTIEGMMKQLNNYIPPKKSSIINKVVS